VKGELCYGARHSTKPAENLRLLSDFFLPFRSHPFDDDCAEVYGVIRNELSRSGKPVGPNDLMIAATAIANDLVLITHDIDEFSRVVGLRWDDWERPGA
jgi:tRNA(fMet)-specific endonuclease VapC